MGRRGYAWSWMEVGTHGDGGLRVDRTGVGFLGGVRGREAALSTEQAGRAECELATMSRLDYTWPLSSY